MRQLYHQEHRVRQHKNSLESFTSRTFHYYRYFCSSAALIAAIWSIAVSGARASDRPVVYYDWVASTNTSLSDDAAIREDSSSGRSPHPSSPELSHSQRLTAQALPSDTPDADPAALDDSIPEPLSTESASPSFGDAGQDRWYVQGAAATTFENEFGMVGAGLSHFFINGHSVNLELNGMAFSQTGDDAVGANLALIMRWHLVRQENWSLYIDGGAGLLGTTEAVPTGGSTFNFTPQAGGGATVRLNEERHLMVGLRWHHISNAELFDGNPGRDSVMGYVGVNFPR